MVHTKQPNLPVGLHIYFTLNIFQMKTAHDSPSKFAVPCCPDVAEGDRCNALDYHYRLRRTVDAREGNQIRQVEVETLIHAHLEICKGPLVLGKLAYSTTLLPGEKVRLFTSDRRNTFTFDSESKVSYKHATSYEDQYYMSSMERFMSDLSQSESSRDASSKSSSNVSSDLEAGGGLVGAIFGGPSVEVSGNFSNASSVRDFSRNLNQHAQSSHNRSVQATRIVNTVSVGEVNSRSHAEGESEDHFESSSRTFYNPNRCHAVSYFFYQLDQQQTVKFTIERIENRLVDPAVDTKLTVRPYLPKGGISIIPAGVLATDSKRLEKEESAKASVASNLQLSSSLANVASARGLQLNQSLAIQQVRPISESTKLAALSKANAELAKIGLLDARTGRISEQTKTELSFSATTSLPTAGVLVRGCLDECEVCEPTLEKEILLELERKQLENDLLKKQIELLDKSQEYRCCPSEPKVA